MNIEEARERCPGIILVPQSPDLYRRAHNTLISEITAIIPVYAVKSIDELTWVRFCGALERDPSTHRADFRLGPRQSDESAGGTLRQIGGVSGELGLAIGARLGSTEFVGPCASASYEKPTEDHFLELH